MLLLLALIAPVGCGERGAQAPADKAAGPPAYGGTLVVAGPSDLDFANGLVSGEVLTQEVLRHALFMTLLRLDEDLQYSPYLARSWEQQGDTALVFHLREDVRWHDGAPTTAYDVAFSFQRAREPKTGFPNAEWFRHWREVQIVDSFTVRFRLEPHADALSGWSLFPIMPRHLLEAIAPERLREAAFNKSPVGNGPFRFVSYRANDRWVFEANPDFPAELGGRPYLDRVVWRVVPENTAQVAELLAGRADLILSPRASQVRELEGRPGVRAIVRPSRKYQFIGWNGRRPPFDDARVRRALAMAVDREEILQVLRGGYGELAVGPIGPFHWAFDASLSPLAFDPAGARALLREAGFADRDGNGVAEDAKGRELTFALTVPAGNDYNRSLAEMIQADLAAVGVRMTVKPTEATTMFADITSPDRRFDAVSLAWESDFRINLRDLFHTGALAGPFQMASYSNAEVDRILDEAPLLADAARALPRWHRLQAILREEQPWMFLFYTPDLYILQDRVQGVEMDVRGPLATLARWWIAPAAQVTTDEGGE